MQSSRLAVAAFMGLATGLCACLLSWAAGWPFEAFIAMKLGGLALGGAAGWWITDEGGAG